MISFQDENSLAVFLSGRVVVVLWRGARKGVINMNYQKLIIAGNVTADAEGRKSKKSDVAYTTFSVAVGDGKNRTTFFPVTVFGKQAKVVAQYVTRGRQVLVEGRIDVSDKGRFNVVADRVAFGAPASKPTRKTKKG